MTILRELWIWMKDAVWFLRISRPGVRVPSIAPRKTSTRCVLVFLFVCTMEGARTRRRRTAPQAISPVGCCLELRVAAPSIRLVPWVALASCWPLPQQLLLASATGRSRRCCRSQWLGMSTVEAVDRKISWLFCFVSHGCTVSARYFHFLFHLYSSYSSLTIIIKYRSFIKCFVNADSVCMKINVFPHKSCQFSNTHPSV